MPCLTMSDGTKIYYGEQGRGVLAHSQDDDEPGYGCYSGKLWACNENYVRRWLRAFDYGEPLVLAVQDRSAACNGENYSAVFVYHAGNAAVLNDGYKFYKRTC